MFPKVSLGISSFQEMKNEQRNWKY